MQELLHSLLIKIVDKKDAIEIEKQEDDHSISFIVKIDKHDFGRVVGRQGKTIKSIRNLLNLKALRLKQNEKEKESYFNKRVLIELEES